MPIKMCSPVMPIIIWHKSKLPKSLSEQGKEDEAIDRLEEFIDEQDDGDVDANLLFDSGQFYKADNQFEDALEMYNKADVAALKEQGGEKPEWMWFLYYFRGVTLDMWTAMTRRRLI